MRKNCFKLTASSYHTVISCQVLFLPYDNISLCAVFFLHSTLPYDSLQSTIEMEDVLKRLLLARLQDRFIMLIENYLREKNLTQDDLAKKVGIPSSHLSNLLHKKRILSATYLLYFFGKGIIMPEDIYDGATVTEREQEFWDTAAITQRLGLLRKIVSAEKSGYNVEALLDAMIQDKK